MKKQIDIVDATPNKRLFLSIIVDYDLNLALCELIDNAIDLWHQNKKKRKLEIMININLDQQVIKIKDNSGGLEKSNLRVIVGPGHTTNLPSDEVIGIFGVGSKRAVIALAQEVNIKTRYQQNPTYQIDVDDNWIKEESWNLPVYEVDDIPEGCTEIELKKLRFKIKEQDIVRLENHLSATYANFLKSDPIIITVQSTEIQSKFFEDWAYPPKFPPHKYVGMIKEHNKQAAVYVEITAGLIKESSPIKGDYGVYFYCNNRLIAKNVKSFEVGYISGVAGLPHPTISLVRVIISLTGSAQSMPWNSSKSDIYYNHSTFQSIRKFLANILMELNILCRKLEASWPETVFQYKEGEIKEIEIRDFFKAKRSYYPPLPKYRERYSDKVRKLNEKIGKQKPWVRGLYESIIAVDLILNQTLEQKNRICLIILDSTLEIAFKEFLIYESGQPYSAQRISNLFNDRTQVETEVAKYSKIQKNYWSRIRYFYKLRCSLIHERATATITNSDILNFREITEKVLEKLFNLSFKI